MIDHKKNITALIFLLMASGCKAPSAVDAVLDKTPTSSANVVSSNLEIAASPNSWSYGNVSTSSTSNKQFTFANNTSKTHVTQTAIVTGAGLSITADTCSNLSLAPAAFCSITVNYTPAATGLVAGSLQLPYDIDSSTTVLLSANGTSPAVAFAFSGFSGSVGTDTSNLTATGVTLQWTPQSSASFYKIQQTDSNGNTSLIGPIAPTSIGSYNIQSLTPGATYTFKINAFDNYSVSDGNNNSVSITTPNVQGATFNGWRDVVATGPVSTNITTIIPTITASYIAVANATPAEVNISWENFTFTPSGTTTNKYNVYRATTAAPTACPGAGCALLGQVTITSPAPNLYTDTTVTAGTTYYYMVRPVVGATEITPAIATDSFIAVTTPAINMALVHRWIANKEMCQDILGSTIDRNNNYRCSYVWGINAGTGIASFAPNVPYAEHQYADVGHSFIADRWTSGCAVTATGPQYGTSDPSGGSDGDIYLKTGTLPVKCFKNKAGTWYQLSDNTLTDADKASMVTNAPGFSLANANQIDASKVCKQKAVPGVGALRLFRKSEAIAAMSWRGDVVAPSAIDLPYIQDGFSHTLFGSCNVKTANGITPGDPALFPDSVSTLINGSYATRNCLTRYKLQDMIGNHLWWTSEQFVNCATNDTCIGVISSLDSGAKQLENFIFDANMGITNNAWNPQPTNFIPHLGLPTYSVDSSLGSITLSNTILNGSRYRFDGSSPTKGLLINTMYHYDSPDQAVQGMGAWSGRFSSMLLDSTWVGSGNSSTGFRCLGEVSP